MFLLKILMIITFSCCTMLIIFSVFFIIVKYSGISPERFGITVNRFNIIVGMMIILLKVVISCVVILSLYFIYFITFEF